LIGANRSDNAPVSPTLSAICATSAVPAWDTKPAPSDVTSTVTGRPSRITFKVNLQARDQGPSTIPMIPAQPDVSASPLAGGAVLTARSGLDSGVKRVGIDETSSRRGHEYVSVFADLDERRGVFVVEGRDHETVQAFSCFLETHGGDPAEVREVCQDMSEAFLKGTLTYLSKAEITFDRYHIKSHLSQAVDEVRREEDKHHRELLANTRYMWLKRPANLTERQRDLLDELLVQRLDTVRAYTLSQQFDSFYELTDPDTAEEYLRRWITEVNDSGLEPLIAFTRMLQDHWLGVIRWHHSKATNGLLEGLNSLIQAAKRRARGYRSNRNFIAMIYLIVGKLSAGPVIA
jgi:transposase